jgi:hypothetical protein
MPHKKTVKSAPAKKAARKGKPMHDEPEQEEFAPRTHRPRTITQGGDTEVPTEAAFPAGEQATSLTEQDVNAEAGKIPPRKMPTNIPPGATPNQIIALHQAGALTFEEPETSEAAEAEEAEEEDE